MALALRSPAALMLGRCKGADARAMKRGAYTNNLQRVGHYLRQGYLFIP